MESSPISARIVRFGSYEADFSAGELRKNGTRIKLQDRPFEILRILLERPGEIITRDEFRHRLWPADTFVDFDHSLNASINKLRLALDDQVDRPRFVATSGRRGYRFIAPVMGIPGSVPTQIAHHDSLSLAGQTLTEELAPGVAQPQLLPKSNIVPAGSKRRTRQLAGALALATLLALSVGLFSRFRPRPLLTELDSILISDFANTTGEPIFDDTLKQALTVKLAESPFFNITPDGKIREQLALMGHQPNDRVVFPIDRELCQRVGAKALVAGSIVSHGSRYEVDLKALDCLNGGPVAQEQTEAENRDQVLPAIGRVLPDLRKLLGESLASLQKFDTPIEQATTSSLAALKAYTEGDKKRQQGADPDAIPFYKLAIELDPNFAISYVRLAAIYNNSQEGAICDQYLRLGYQHREHVSEREKLYITASYLAVANDEGPILETYRLWRKIYPRDWIPGNNLARECIRVGRLDEAIEASQSALRLNPKHSFPYSNLANAYKRSGRFAEAKAICERAIAEKLDSAEIHKFLYDMAYAESDNAGIQRELDWSKGQPREEWIRMYSSWGAMALGQVRKARELFRDTEQMVSKKGLKEYAAVISLDEAQFLVELGYTHEGAAMVARAYSLAPLSRDDLAAAALVLARDDDDAKASAIAQELAGQYPLDTLLNKVELAQVRAAIALNRKNPAQAIEELKSSVPYDLGSPPDLWTMYYRGLAYLQLGSAKDAVAEFKKLLDHRAALPESVVVSLARIGLARAYVRSGDLDRGRTSYQEFFLGWKAADADVPILKEARAEYARLGAQ